MKRSSNYFGQYDTPLPKMPEPLSDDWIRDVSMAYMHGRIERDEEIEEALVCADIDARFMFVYGVIATLVVRYVFDLLF